MLPIFATILLCSPSLCAEAQDADAALEQRVDALFGRLNETPSPGVAIVFVRDGKVILRKGYGMADLEHRVRITPSTVLHIGSCGKQITGLALAMLISQGKVRLGDDIRKYVPEMPDFGQPITIEQLLRHTSGLRDWTAPMHMAGWNFDDPITFPQIMRFAYKQRTLNFAPGSRDLYSNTGYSVLAELVQRVSGKPFSAWCSDNIFQPLGMADTRVRVDTAEVIPNMALGYSRSGVSDFRRMPDNMISIGSSSVWSTVDDLAKWMMNFDTGAVGGKEAIELMQRPGTLNNGSKVQYGFGLAYGSEKGHPLLNHTGGWAGVTTFIAYFPKDRLGVAAIANGPIPNFPGNVYGIALSCADVEVPSNAPQTTATSQAAPPPPLDDYAGLYRFDSGEYVRIRRFGNAIYSQVTERWPEPLSQGAERTTGRVQHHSCSAEPPMEK